MHLRSWIPRLLGVAMVFTLLAPSSWAAARRRATPVRHAKRAKAAASAQRPAVKRKSRVVARSRPASTHVRAARFTRSPAAAGPIVRGGPWTEPTFADSTVGDNVDGEDLDIRRAAVEALGGRNGSVVVADPATGRILSMVNQRLVLGSGFQPCSTIKVTVALSALGEHVIGPQNTAVRMRRGSIDLTYALAHSNNYYFATLGQRLGFAQVSRYARQFGYGEKAGYGIPGEQPGLFPTAAPANGGVGMLSSFGEGIRQTPLQLAALMGAVANGGTLYYLQYPRNAEEAQHFVPRVKRQLRIAGSIPVIEPGLRGAVDFGTARRAHAEDPLAGKTGTCTDGHTHLGWFGAYNQVGDRKLVVVVLLTGGRPSIGPAAAGVAGEFFRSLGPKEATVSMISRRICCAR